jgi:hypothetical protein
MNIQEIIKKFIDDAEKRYPELVEPEEFAMFLTHLYQNAKLILARTDFNVWVNEKAEVAVFLARRINLERYDIHVQGNQLGHYKVMVYGDGNRYEYVEIEWVPKIGCASPQKVFKITEKITEPASGVPLGELISTWQLLFG